jgi:hypothetical protein
VQVEQPRQVEELNKVQADLIQSVAHTQELAAEAAEVSLTRLKRMVSMAVQAAEQVSTLAQVQSVLLLRMHIQVKASVILEA